MKLNDRLSEKRTIFIHITTAEHILLFNTFCFHCRNTYWISCIILSGPRVNTHTPCNVCAMYSSDCMDFSQFLLIKKILQKYINISIYFILLKIFLIYITLRYQLYINYHKRSSDIQKWIVTWGRTTSLHKAKLDIVLLSRLYMHSV